MAKKVCRCGAIVEDRCPKCDRPAPHQKTTAERGYGNDWRKLSEYKRTADPLCEECLKSDKVVEARHVHHIKPIKNHPHLRLHWDNLISVCIECHERLEAEQEQKP